MCRSRCKCGRGLAPDGGLRADQDVGLDRVHIHFCGNGCLGFRPDGGARIQACVRPAWFNGPPKIKSASAAAFEPTGILCRSRSKCGRGLAPDGGLRADQDVGLDRVHIHFCGNGCLGFRPDGGPRIQACVRPAWFNGAPKIKRKSAAAFEPTGILCRSHIWTGICIPMQRIAPAVAPMLTNHL